MDQPTQSGSFEIVKAPTLVAQVRDRILQAIVQGEIKPGERLSEADLARRLGVSRGPVREAGRLLEQSGLLQSEPRKGFFVRTIRIEDIENFFEFRTGIIVHAARLAKERATPKDKAMISQIYQRICDVAADERNPLAALEANYDLQRYISGITGNPRFTAAIEEIILEGRLIATILNLVEHKPGLFYTETMPPLIEAFQTGTPDEVAREMEIFLNRNHEAVLQFYRERDAAG